MLPELCDFALINFSQKCWNFLARALRSSVAVIRSMAVNIVELIIYLNIGTSEIEFSKYRSHVVARHAPEIVSVCSGC